ncbi:MAG: NAD(P)H-dependent oxidoreductase [Muribaculaceae bacterium]|nr:NAD(P)H-dependent oxidoreductase [Muribaculaceae bacterium]
MKAEKILIAYFSQKGKEETSNSAKLAKKAEELLKSKGVAFDTFAIVPVETYPEDQALMEMATKAEKERRVRPAIVSKYSDGAMKEITGVILIAPNWWDSLPQAVYTFMDEEDFAKTRVVPVISTDNDAEHVRREVRDFLKNWVLPGVDVKGSDDADAKLKEAIDQLFEPSESKY